MFPCVIDDVIDVFSDLKLLFQRWSVAVFLIFWLKLDLVALFTFSQIDFTSVSIFDFFLFQVFHCSEVSCYAKR